MSLAKNIAAAAHLVRSHAELAAELPDVFVTNGGGSSTDITLQLDHHGDELVTVARWALALGISHVSLEPQREYVRVLSRGEVETPVGVVQVKVWTHLDVWKAAPRVASQFQLTLSPDSGPVFLEAAQVVRASEAAA
ncbi:hypothetical protein [Saccharothrix obliqua]|uniref:hypothetical protein n=1 Tax=Saccharothrix obliqua TaxID=2861747 RepID=UPI001C5D1689|nr:hypothetical protein [Saccharothrix obliqua]MBW4717414.1 hypothetical protein [Saccharothrix obliqua]